MAQLTHFGAWLKERRTEQGIDQVMIAEAAGISQSQLSRAECGLSELTLTQFLRWADALEIGRRRWLEGFALLKADLRER